MPKRTWANGVIGNTPLEASRLNEMETDLEDALLALARTPEALFSGAVMVDTNGAQTSANVVWPDGIAGVYSGTASMTWPGAIDSYTITRASAPTLTFTQPMVTRNSDGAITNRPQITVS